MKKNTLSAVFILVGVFALSGWYLHNLQNYTFYYSDSEKKEVLAERDKLSVTNLKMQYDECFWRETYDCRELMRGLKISGYMSDREWAIVDGTFYNKSDEAEKIRLAALNKLYDKRAEKEKSYKELKHFNQFLFEEVLILISMVSLVSLFRDKK